MDTPQSIAEQWLKAVAYTVATNDVETHLDLFSHRLEVIGISKRGFLHHEEWTQRRRNDMETRRLLRISHERFRLLAYDQRKLVFQVEETLKSTLGESYVLDKEVMLEQEPDERWRAVTETVNTVRPVRSIPRQGTAAPEPRHEATDAAPQHEATDPDASPWRNDGQPLL